MRFEIVDSLKEEKEDLWGDGPIGNAEHQETSKQLEPTSASLSALISAIGTAILTDKPVDEKLIIEATKKMAALITEKLQLLDTVAAKLNQPVAVPEVAKKSILLLPLPPIVVDLINRGIWRGYIVGTLSREYLVYFSPNYYLRFRRKEGEITIEKFSESIAAEPILRTRYLDIASDPETPFYNNLHLLDAMLELTQMDKINLT